LWKEQFAGLGVQELREMRQLREENTRLERLVADLSQDQRILQEIVSKSSEATPPMPAGLVGTGDIPSRQATRGHGGVLGCANNCEVDVASYESVGPYLFDADTNVANLQKSSISKSRSCGDSARPKIDERCCPPRSADRDTV